MAGIMLALIYAEGLLSNRRQDSQENSNMPFGCCKCPRQSLQGLREHALHMLNWTPSHGRIRHA